MKCNELKIWHDELNEMKQNQNELIKIAWKRERARKRWIDGWHGSIPKSLSYRLEYLLNVLRNIYRFVAE